MRRALVAIGVNAPASGFSALRAAADGAKQIAAWASDPEQGFDVTLLTDEDGHSVTVAEVFASIQKIVKAKVYSQLIVYFSGHGILLSPDAEVWLLSGALANPNEAINVSGSIAVARTSGISHIVFVSDACRSMPPNFLAGSVSAGRIFPTCPTRQPLPEIDVFYATLPGDPALEVGPTAAENAFRGLLTSCMVKALKGMPQTIVEQIVDGTTTRKVIASRPLKGHLVQAIPDAAAAYSISLSQSPDIRVESALPKYLANLGSLSPPPAPVAPPPAPSSSAAPAVGAMNVADVSATRAGPTSIAVGELTTSWKMSLENIPFPAGPPLPPLTEAGEIRDSVGLILESTGRRSFETRTGFTVHGSTVRSVRVIETSQPSDVWREPGYVTQVRIYADYDPVAPPKKRLALMRFGDGTGIVLSVLPGFIGSVVTQDGKVLTVNYAPSHGTPGYEEYAQNQRSLEERRAMVATAARLGNFRLDKETASQVADRLRYLKRLDPTLGLYAAYAYAQAGNIDGVLSVYSYMLGDPAPVLFDVAMLAAQYSDLVPQDLDFAPWLPVLTQGWLLLGRFEDEMPAPVRDARAYLMPGLWTTFAREGMDILEARVTTAR